MRKFCFRVYKYFQEVCFLRKMFGIIKILSYLCITEFEIRATMRIYTKADCMLAFDCNQITNNDFVYFWKHDEEPGKVTKACFSQWYPSCFVVDGVAYNCAEQYMMAEKALFFDDEEIWKKIISASDPEKIKKLGREVRNFDAERWDKASEDVVLKGNLHKFGQNKELLDFLLSTERKTLVEASPYDRIWGIGMSEATAKRYGYPHVWKGENKLGFILMGVREIFRNNNY